MSKKKIIIFGTGSISKLLVDHKKNDVDIIAFLADGEDREQIDGIPVISTDRLKEIEFDYIIIAFGNSMRGIELLRQRGIAEDKIIAYTYCDLPYADSVFQNQLDDMIKDALHSNLIPEMFKLPQKKHFICSMNVREDYDVIGSDYVREQTLSFLAEEIKRRNIPGSVAEIGVSSGEFAAKISKVFPDRTIYLFDTFSGLPEIDRKKAINLGWGERAYALHESGTREEDVLKNMPDPENCIIKKGYFPDSYDITENLAFVSLDIDFYDSVKRGLELVYPQISKGGYIMVHDYHNLAFSESKQAVIDFCDINGISLVPIPDKGGTAIIIK